MFWRIPSRLVEQSNKRTAECVSETIKASIILYVPATLYGSRHVLPMEHQSQSARRNILCITLDSFFHFHIMISCSAFTHFKRGIWLRNSPKVLFCVFVIILCKEPTHWRYSILEIKREQPRQMYWIRMNKKIVYMFRILSTHIAGRLLRFVFI